MKLQLKHLAGYLPYGLKGVLIADSHEEFEYCDIDEDILKEGSIWEYSGHVNNNVLIPLGDGDLDGFLMTKDGSYACCDSLWKPILRPLSDLTKEIEVNGVELVPLTALFGDNNQRIASMLEWINNEDAELCGFGFTISVYDVLLKWNFDIHGLIEQGLAVDINTLNDKE